MKVNLGELNPGAWFDLPGGGRVRVRVAPPAILKQIQSKTTKKKVEYRRGGRFEIVETDDEKADRLLWDYIVVDWQGIEDDSGNAVPCTLDNKVLLMGQSIVFGSVVAEDRTGRSKETGS